MNKIIITGRLTKDPEFRTTNSQLSVCSFSVAVDRASKNGEKAVDFFDCVAFRKTAECISKYFMKGKPIMVAGKMQMRDYTDKNGNKRRAWELIVDDFEFMGGERKAEAKVSIPAGEVTQAELDAMLTEEPDLGADDLPFDL